jgi:hypothetical protein
MHCLAFAQTVPGYVNRDLIPIVVQGTGTSRPVPCPVFRTIGAGHGPGVDGHFGGNDLRYDDNAVTVAADNIIWLHLDAATSYRFLHLDHLDPPRYQ